MITTCRTCGNEKLETFLSLGSQPLANSFLKKEDLDKEEPKFPLEVCFCSNCALVQLTFVVPPELMFSNYVYVSSTSQTFRNHFLGMAETLTAMFHLDSSSLAVDIGSNDGLLLSGFKKFGVRTVGIEPAANIALSAQQNGIETINEFFSASTASKIVNEKGSVDIVTANNVFAHIHDIKSVVENVKKMLKDDGVFVIEAHYLFDMIEKMNFGAVYHEHLSHYTATALVNFFKKQEMAVFRIDRVPTHGGSLRVFVQKNSGKHPVDSSVSNLLKEEENKGVQNKETYALFASKVLEIKDRLTTLLKELKDKGSVVAGFGAPAKMIPLLNFCSIGPSEIQFIVDENPLKQGLLTPGTHIPVVSMSELEKNLPDYLLILAWDFAEEIMRKTASLHSKGVKYIIPFPELRII